MYTEYSDRVVAVDGRIFPKTDGNRDYREFLTWVDAGNTPAQPPAPVYEVPIAEYRRRIPTVVKDALLALAQTDAQVAQYLQSLAVYAAIDVDSPEHGAALDYLTTALAGGLGEITTDIRNALEAPL